MLLTEKDGDLLVEAELGNVDVIVHQANLEHTFGAGIARAIRFKFPYAFEADKKSPFNDPRKLGTFTLASSPDGPLVINMYSQTSLYPSHTSYDAMVKALTELRDRLTPLEEFRRIGFPYQLGSGLADGDWNVVKAIILSVFQNSRFEIVIVRLRDQKPDFSKLLENVTFEATPKTLTDADVEFRLQALYSGLQSDNLLGIYRIRRQKGESVHEAYNSTLRAYLFGSEDKPISAETRQRQADFWDKKMRTIS